MKDSLSKFQSFQDLALPEALGKALTTMGFINPTPVQAETIPAALEGKDILATAQTGTGKTGAFGIPVLANLFPYPKKQALILAPTRELAAQILKVMDLMASGSKIYGMLMVGGDSFQRQVRELEKGVDFIIATPGRLYDHLERRTMNLSRVSIFVLDEVDRMLDMGFAPQIQRILRYLPRERQTMLFSATLPPDVMGLTQKLLKNPVRVSIGSSETPAESVKQEILHVSQQEKLPTLLKVLEGTPGKALVFVRTQTKADQVTKVLERAKQKVVCMHGGLRNAQRKDALRKFADGIYRVMVATDLAGRGIDVSDIEHVINYDIPSNREDYIHRIGRTGRFGKEGSAVTFVTPIDLDADYIVTGKKRTPRVVFRSRRR